ncbi:N-acetylglucosamine kinase-like BadF-type ATPase [Algoriphagus ratkowskyi]|uniref:N-acetylglucosamine kinase n=1 Tax=Algoriphagus ratkowskyi TaxID=57028 RepID=A0A2W7R3C5_9BACT|nr:N-acetylglucosamine kinase [Algoriphagus ratkowskyi]PZX54661.1 N-acetylglucosamine kinase-like BadF-type ATPase [Algoriphagus ratkowskyi]TXD76973.1 N-acetylglucosamine kinase [Algoriphagus ratkowskyi]
MILIADSGSSKTDWRVIHSDMRISQHRGIGFNPYYQTSEEMSIQMQNSFLVNLETEIEEIFFYGAGCSTDDRRNDVSSALKTVFPKAKITIDHDLNAAAKATCGHQSGIACILGTGSNSCDYDGKQIVDKRPSPGYIFGDEGGGGYVGRKLLKDFINDEMPLEIKQALIDSFQLNSTMIQENVYQQPFPNRYMASFCKFITEHKSNLYCYMLYYNSFQEFFKQHVMKYKDYTEKPVNFVGSIAFYNNDILRKAASDLQINVNLIIESPIAGLTLYHKEKL